MSYKPSLFHHVLLLILFLGLVRIANGQTGSLTYSTTSDISTSDYNGDNFNISGQTTNPRCVQISPDGTRVFVLSTDPSNSVFQYNLTNPHDITSASYSGNELNVNAQENEPEGITFSKNGEYMYLVGDQNNSQPIVYTLSNPFELSSAVYASSNNMQHLTLPNDAGSGIAIRNNGRRIFISLSNEVIRQYDLDTPYDLTSATDPGLSIDVTMIDIDINTLESLTFNNNGSGFFFTERTEDRIRSVGLSAVFNLGSFTSLGNRDVSDQDSGPRGVAVSGDGTRLYMVGDGDSPSQIYQYELTNEVFEESSADDGSVDGELIINLVGDQFVNNTTTVENNLTINNLPAGLGFNVAFSNTRTTLTVTLTGNATLNDDIHSVSDLQLTFSNGAFSTLNTSSISNSTNFNTGLGLDFIGPPIFTSGNTASGPENSTSDVLDIQANNGDGGSNDSNVSYSITGGADASFFAIDSSDGRLRFVTARDFENPQDNGNNNTYVVQVTATDDSGLTTTQTITVTVTDVNEDPVITSANSASFTENGTGTVLDIQANDGDGGASDVNVTYSITGGVDASLFNINGASGLLTFSTAPDFENPIDSDFDNDYLLEVTAADAVGAATVSQTITITVTNDTGEPLPTQPLGATNIYFDGVDDAINIPASTDFDVNDEVTYSIWVKVTNPSANGGLLFRRIEGSIDDKRVRINASRTVQFFLFPTAVGVNFTTTDQIPLNEWTHIACTYERNATAKIYFNGVEVASSTTSNTAVGNAGTTGSFQIGTPNFFEGHVDEFKIFNTAHTQTEIESDMASTNPAESDLVAYWNFDDDQTAGNQTTVEDVVNGNDGTFSGAPLWVTRVSNTLDDTNQGSLRYALTQANTDSDQDYIDFSISGTGVQTIHPTAALPIISQSVLIDGYTQAGASPNTLDVGNDAILNIQLDGTGTSGNGLTISADNSEVYGLIIHGFGSGILISGTDNTIAGCQIGLDASGNPSANVHGIYVQTDDVTIGLPTPAGRNTISGNQFNGILIQNDDWVNTTVQNNYLGTNPDGLSAPSPNQQRGIRSFGSSSLYGGTTALERNVFSGNVDSGLSFARASGSDNNIVLGNFIGVGADGATPLGNGGSGIQFFADDIDNHQIGGIQAGEGNIIANNAIGIFLGGTTSTGNSIRGNSIFGNTIIGIDLAPTGANTNDPDDADTGNNNLQNFPLINTAERSGENLAINFSVDATAANSAYGTTGLKIDFYKSDGNRQGEEYLGTINYPVGSAQSSFTGFVPLGTIVSGDVIVATATDDDGNTSEFSEEFIVNNLPTAANNTLVVNEDEVLTIVTGNFNYSDTDSNPFTLINITSIPAQGMLYLDADNDDTFDTGEVLAVNDQVLIADLNAGNLQFLGSENGNGTPFTSFGFNVNDGLGNSSLDYTMTINVIAVNDGPAIDTNAGLPLDEGSSVAISISELSSSDIDNSATELIYTITTDPIRGTLNSSSFTQQDIIYGNLTYTHDGSENFSDGFNFTVTDGVITSTVQSFIITINPVNDNFPTLDVNAGLTVDEGQTFVLGLTEVNASDIDGDELTIHVVSEPTHGTLSLTSFSLAQLNSGAVTYTHNDSENFTDTFEFTVTDDVNTTTSQIFNISITAINDNVPVINQGLNFGVIETASNGTSLGFATATDGDIGTVFQNWSIISGNTDNIFGINISTGELIVADNTSLDFDTTPSYVLSLTVSDGTNTSLLETISISLSNTDEFPIPTISVLPDIMTECTASPTPPTANDPEDGLITAATTTTFPITLQGTTTVIWTFTDTGGNSTTQSQDVIIDDVTAPVPDVAVLPDVTAECELASLTPPTATDNCTGVVTATTSATFPINTQGTTAITWTFDDGNGNTSTQSQNVIIDDATAPAPDVAVLPDVTAECELASLIPPTATDNCEGTVTATTATTFPINTQGTTTITWTFDDGNGNTSIQSQNVIIDDATAPAPDVAVLPDVTAECELASLISPTSTDNCTGIITATTATTLPINTQGTTTITWTFDDGNGNTSIQSQNVIIDDATAPVPDVAVLPDVTAECELLSLTPPTATDNCEGTVTATTATTFPINTQGTTTIIWTFDDGNENTSTQSQNIIIDDVTAPVFSSENAVSFLGNSADIAYQALAIDNCSQATISYTISGSDAGLFNLESTSGELLFVTIPDFETPLDLNGDNGYEVEIIASDGTNSSVQNVLITVVDVIDLFPKIEVFVGPDNTGTQITANQTTAINWGNAIQGNDISQTFTIENLGTSLLTINDITVTTTDFSIINNLTTIDVGSSGSFDVVLSGSASGTFEAMLNINSDDQDEGTFSFPIIGTITATPQPQIMIQLDTIGDRSSLISVANDLTSPILLNSVLEDDLVSFELIVGNSGNTDLNISSIVSDNPVFVLSSFDSVVGTNSTESINVSIQQLKGVYTTYIEILSNSLNDATFNIPIEIEFLKEQLEVYVGEDTTGVSIFNNQTDDIDVGQTQVNVEKLGVFTIVNNGDIDLTINGISLSNPAFEVRDAPSLISVGESANFLIVLFSSDVGVFNTDVTVNSSAQNFTFSMTGEVIDLSGEELPDLEVFNVVTPNGDGVHDFLKIENIELYPDNQVQVFTRSGQRIFDVRGYDNDQVVFEGESNVNNRRTLNNGTYYYLIDDGVNRKKNTGFFVLTK